MKKLRLAINVLMAVAVTGALLIDEVAEAAGVVFLLFSEPRIFLVAAKLEAVFNKASNAGRIIDSMKTVADFLALRKRKSKSASLTRLEK